ncbi:MAG: tRNA (cytidine(34)-2'-O)-methyltransferase [Planctomycetota bacterium]
MYRARPPSDYPLHIVLYHPEIPPNAGNAGRTCVALGAKLWMVRPLGFEIDNKHLRRAGIDYWEHLDWEVVDDWESLTARLPQPYWYFSKSGRKTHLEAKFRRGDVLVFGSESSGLPAEWARAEPERFLRIPVGPKVRSLNLAVSVGVAAYEAWRQTGGFSVESNA